MRVMRFGKQVPVFVLALGLAPVWAGEPQAAGVPNFHQVNERVFRGGQPTDDGWKSLAGLGIKTVVDLRPASEHSTDAEARSVQAAGMRYINVPMRGFYTPSQEEVSKVLALFESSDGPVFVHCRRGSDRTGTVIACYRVSHDQWKNDKAYKEARSYGMYWLERGMKDYILNYKPEKQIAGGAEPQLEQPAATQP